MALVTQTAQICLVIATLLYRGRGIVGHLIEALGFHAELLLVVASVCPSPNGRSRRGSEEAPDCRHRTIVQGRCVRPDAIKWRGGGARYERETGGVSLGGAPPPPRELPKLHPRGGGPARASR